MKDCPRLCMGPRRVAAGGAGVGGGGGRAGGGAGAAGVRPARPALPAVGGRPSPTAPVPEPLLRPGNKVAVDNPYGAPPQ